LEIKDIISSGLLELYATGLASAEEAAQVLQWLQQYPEVADELAAIEAGLALYAQGQVLPPSPSVKEKLFTRINDTGEQAKVVAMPTSPAQDNTGKIAPFWKTAAAASVALLLGSAALNIIQYNKNAVVSTELEQSRSLVSQLEGKNKEMDQYLERVRDKYSTPVSLAGLKATDASAKVFWMKNTGDVYVDPANLPEPPSGKQYELWAIVDGAPVNAGIIISTKKGNTYNIQKMKSFGTVQVQAFAVSVEPQSTTPAVTPTEVYALGKM
jgi:anti-sigma-K factor RskA